MLARMMRLRCAGHGEKPTIVDSVKGAGIILGGTLLAVLAATWMRRRGVDSIFSDTLLHSGWLFAFVLSMPYTSLKGWPRLTQAIFMGILLVLVALLTAGGTWISR